MRRSPVPGLDLDVYVRALPLLARNPSIVVVPLLMAVVAVLIGQLFAPYGGGVFAIAAGGLSSLVVLLLEMFGLGAACIVADDAWRHGRASFDRGWEEARRRAGSIFMAAIGFSLLLAVASYAGALFGPLTLILLALAVYFLVWTIPAAAIGGIPGGAAIQASIDRVRANPLPAAVVTVVSIVVLYGVGMQLPYHVAVWLLPYMPGTPIAASLIAAVFQAIALSYIALILTKTYSDAAFGTRRF